MIRLVSKSHNIIVIITEAVLICLLAVESENILLLWVYMELRHLMTVQKILAR